MSSVSAGHIILSRQVDIASMIYIYIYYTDTDPTSRERAATAGIEPGTSSPEWSALPTELPWFFEVVSVTVALYTTHLVRHCAP